METFTVAHAPGTCFVRAVSHVIATLTGAPQVVLERDQARSSPALLPETILILDCFSGRNDLAVLRHLRVQEYRGAELLLTARELADLQERRRLLCFGESPRRTWRPGSSLSSLFRMLDELQPLSVGNLSKMRQILLLTEEFVERHLRERLLPCLERVSHDPSAQQDLALMIEQLRGATTYTCHEKIYFEGCQQTLAHHLVDNLSRLSDDPTREQAIRNLRTLLEIWYRLALDHDEEPEGE